MIFGEISCDELRPRVPEADRKKNLNGKIVQKSLKLVVLRFHEKINSSWLWENSVSWYNPTYLIIISSFPIIISFSIESAWILNDTLEKLASLEVEIHGYAEFVQNSHSAIFGWVLCYFYDKSIQQGTSMSSAQKYLHSFSRGYLYLPLATFSMFVLNRMMVELLSRQINDLILKDQRKGWK